MPKVITVYEQSTLPIGPDFSLSHFEALAKYHDQVDSKLFSLGYRSIRFTQFVGILAVGELILEVLPKLDAASVAGKVSVWRGVLIDMLVDCGILKPQTVNRVRQTTSQHTLLDLFITQFIEEVETLCRRGLAKGYRSESSNVSALRGRLDFPRHLARNGVCADRWFTEHTVYDRDIPCNGILKKALALLAHRAPKGSRGRIRALLLELEGVAPFLPPKGFLNRLRTNRNTEHYRPAIELAWMIIRDHAPDLGPGHHDVLALMFDMERVFEGYLIQSLVREGRCMQPQVLCTPKDTCDIWGKMSLVPDVVARVATGPEAWTTFIVDAKWKCPKGSTPDPADLRQVLAYNLYFNSRQAFLVYPSLTSKEGQSGEFLPMKSNPEHRHSCEVHFLRLIDESGGLCRTSASLLLQKAMTGLTLA